MTCKAFVILMVISASLFAIVMSGPIHAQCAISWKFGESCSAVQDALVSQIKKWNGPAGCDNGGEKCRYALVSQSDSTLKATHTTPKKHYVDDLVFSFSAANNGGCTVKGNSRSETWYAVLDYGTNYCNLRNLIDGAGLDKVTGFAETTSDDICTQFSSHNCTVY